MKTTKMLTILILAFAVVLWQAEVSNAEPMGTAWTYQGRLMDANLPADQFYDFRFRLFDEPSDGNQVGIDINTPDVDVIDGYFTVALDFNDVGVFNGYARWLEIAARQADSNDPNAFVTLIPRQEITPTPYALQTRGIFVDDSGNVCIGGTDPWYALDVYKAMSDSWVAGFHNTGTGDMDGGVIVRAFGGDPLLVRSATENVLNVKQNGNVGIGTVNPDELLTLEKPGHGNSAPQLKIKGYYPGSSGGSYLVLGKSRGSNVGENVTTQNNDPLGLIDTLGINTSNNEAAATRIIFRQDGNAGSSFIPGRIEFYSSNGSSGATERMRIDKNGNVGIGMTEPGSRLDIKASSGSSAGGLRITSSTNDNQVITLQDATPGDQGQIAIRAGGSDKIVLRADGNTYFNGGNVGIGTTGNLLERLTVRGNILVQSVSTGASVAEIGEGLDYAEGFNVTEDTDIEAGTVLVIDSYNPGKLTISRSAYDKKVAGIVAGANGMGSGVRLGIGQFDYDVALAGRVYCNVDATEQAVQAGDLLTTSATPGYAMKATDYDRAHGAILGKAMQKLQQGQKAQILVLVTLQ